MIVIENKVVSIALPNGLETIIDSEDYNLVKTLRWHLTGWGYVQWSNKRMGKFILLHRLIMNAPIGMEVDHINQNKLDNRRCNLRVVTRQQNECNKPIGCTNTSGYKGVSYHNRDRVWRAKIRDNGREIYIGAYKTPVDAAIAYNKKAIEINGEYAFLNNV